MQVQPLTLSGFYLGSGFGPGHCINWLGSVWLVIRSAADFVLSYQQVTQREIVPHGHVLLANRCLHPSASTGIPIVDC